MKKLIQWTGGTLTTIVLTLGFTTYLFISLSPQFGATATDAQLLRYEQSANFADGVFVNLEPFSLILDCHSIVEMIKKALTGHPNLAPKKDIEVVPYQPSEKVSTSTRVTWLGHSSFIIEMSGKTILLDPVFSQYAAPHPWLGVTRYSNEMPVTIEQLPAIDMILVSHDHYDHLDYNSIKELLKKTQHFVVPLGVGRHLEKWEVEPERITEMDWWDQATVSEIDLVFTPSKHMSGRGLNDQKTSLWGSWILDNGDDKIYFSGDSGYGQHFKDIGDKYGPFDLGLMECGQYDELWPDVHMSPEQSVQAAIDLGVNMSVPIHWGSFTLANHAWTDPAERFTTEAMAQGITISTPQIGESIVIKSDSYPTKRWWGKYMAMAN